jgi:hypothetical protein
MSLLTIYRGRDFSVTLKFAQPSGDPMDISGCRVLVTFKKKVDEDPADATAFYKTDITTHSNPTGGESELTIPWTQTKAFAKGSFVYDVELIDAAGQRLQISSASEIGQIVQPVTNRE